jgi:hypothetical protein
VPCLRFFAVHKALGKIHTCWIQHTQANTLITEHLRYYSSSWLSQKFTVRRAIRLVMHNASYGWFLWVHK